MSAKNRGLGGNNGIVHRTNYFVAEAALAVQGQKKAQPGGCASENPPKEEVLEECAAASSASTRDHYSSAQGPMQAFSAALQYIVDSSPLFLIKSVN
jgi:hypothetical protein